MVDYQNAARKLMDDGLNDVLEVQVSAKRIQAKLGCSRDFGEVVKSILETKLRDCTVTVKPRATV